MDIEKMDTINDVCMEIEKLDINAVCFGILCNFTPACGEERAKEAVALVRSLQAENTQLRAELEKVMKERNAALDDLNGLCGFCIHGNKWGKAPEWSSLTFCEHLGGAIAAAGNAKRMCKHWQWRGWKED